MTEEFDFTKGGEFHGGYYPALKITGDGIVSYNEGASTYYDYQPGNMTRYQVVFSKYPSEWGGTETLMSIVNMNTCMVIPGEMNMLSLDYMMEKLGLMRGDCYALIPLINRYVRSDRGNA